MNCCCSKLIGYARGAVTFKEAVIYQILRYALCDIVCSVNEMAFLPSEE